MTYDHLLRACLPTYSEAKEADDTGLAAPPFAHDLGGENQRGSANGGASKAAEELERGVDPNVGRESGEKRSDAHDEAGEEERVLSPERGVSQRGQPESSHQAPHEEARSGKPRYYGVGALQTPL